jgi:hypothetical protein
MRVYHPTAQQKSPDARRRGFEQQQRAADSFRRERLGGSANARGGVLSCACTPPDLPNKNPGNVLLSHQATLAVPSALEGLTAVFGMGTGVTPPPWSPG